MDHNNNNCQGLFLSDTQVIKRVHIYINLKSYLNSGEEYQAEWLLPI